MTPNSLLTTTPKCEALVQALAATVEAARRRHLVGPCPVDRQAMLYIGGASNPAQRVSLRTIDPDVIAIVNVATGAVIEEIEQSKAFFQVYDGAVYMFQGRTFLCRRLDVASRVAEVSRCYQTLALLDAHNTAFVHSAARLVCGGDPVAGEGPAGSQLKLVRQHELGHRMLSCHHTMAADVLQWPVRYKCLQVVPTTVRYYTRTIDFRDVHITGSRHAYPQPSSDQYPYSYPGTTARCNAAVVTHRFVGFTRIWRGSGVAFDSVRLFLPDIRLVTEATYVRFAAAPFLRTKKCSLRKAPPQGKNQVPYEGWPSPPPFCLCEGPAAVQVQCASARSSAINIPFTLRTRFKSALPKLRR
jgi:ATP-dependent helicase YprA (DUF1998 family)